MTDVDKIVNTLDRELTKAFEKALCDLLVVSEETSDKVVTNEDDFKSRKMAFYKVYANLEREITEERKKALDNLFDIAKADDFKSQNNCIDDVYNRLERKIMKARKRALDDLWVVYEATPDEVVTKKDDFKSLKRDIYKVYYYMEREIDEARKKALDDLFAFNRDIGKADDFKSIKDLVGYACANLEREIMEERKKALDALFAVNRDIGKADGCTRKDAIDDVYYNMRREIEEAYDRTFDVREDVADKEMFHQIWRVYNLTDDDNTWYTFHPMEFFRVIEAICIEVKEKEERT